MYTKETRRNQEGAIVDRREMLRVKLKSLAAEARFIRREEQRTWGPMLEELHRHRIFVVRRAARETHLAYGFIRGLSYEQMEGNAQHNFDHVAVRKMCATYGPKGQQWLPEFLLTDAEKAGLKRSAQKQAEAA